ncbi:MAG: CrcB family protein [Gemmataceae bacterium]|nr:CrcB family protein [Gemmataceae bacterium]
MHTLSQVALVAFGSALGGLLRWFVAVACGRLFGTAFPWGTFLINMSGSLFLGWFLTILADRLATNGPAWLRADDLRLLVAVGFTGSYTTFATLEFETHSLLRDGDSLKGLTYVAASVLLGLVAVRLGVLLARAE